MGGGSGGFAGGKDPQGGGRSRPPPPKGGFWDPSQKNPDKNFQRFVPKRYFFLVWFDRLFQKRRSTQPKKLLAVKFPSNSRRNVGPKISALQASFFFLRIAASSIPRAFSAVFPNSKFDLHTTSARSHPSDLLNTPVGLSKPHP